MAKWNKIANALLWILGALIVLGQIFAVVNYYVFDSGFNFQLRDIWLLITAIGLLFLPNEIKNKVRFLIRKLNPLRRK
ncbi:hypothetical protein U6A24_12600 [Aquimarina gracilis]|uniref:Uncharacterized protein n=1 Tax=Aquimarina gracilis TaxID=874422 RepID=A0ABU5ZWQ8_9FLAO|nr:hypothetical protein [Aquimarina gracilis]MEB3346309.1 hypothetical protein [Aquimarina gracilis]